MLQTSCSRKVQPLVLDANHIKRGYNKEGVSVNHASVSWFDVTRIGHALGRNRIDTFYGISSHQNFGCIIIENIEGDIKHFEASMEGFTSHYVLHHDLHVQIAISHIQFGQFSEERWRRKRHQLK